MSSEDAETIVRWQTPPSRMRTPEPPSSFETDRSGRRDIGTNAAAYTSNTPLVRFDEEQIRSLEVEAEQRSSNMEEQLEDTPPTPTMDDTPYIRFAIDQLTRDEEIAANRASSQSSEYPVERIIPGNTGFAYMSPEKEREAMRLVRKHRSTPSTEGRLFRFNATRPLSMPLEPEPAVPITPRISAIFIPVDAPAEPRHPDLTFVPVVLQPLSMITLSILCLLMTAAILFCTIYSMRNDGLWEWESGIYDVRYFVFGYLPQILAAMIFIYVQAVMAAMTRILPYTMMANDDADHRANALFLGIFPRSLLFPRWEGPLSFEIAHSVFWLSVFTIPLQSSLFSVVLVDGVWRWTAVQGVAWAAVAIYTLMFLATLTFGVFFFRRTTGLMWDPISLADIMSLLPRSNSFNDYPGTDVMKSREQLKERLASRSDRLGYWRTQNKNQGMFYCIGEHGVVTRRYTTLTRDHAAKSSFESDLFDVEKRSVDFSKIRFRHLPWFLRDTFVIFWVVAAFVLLTALLVVSFLPRTAIRNGFSASVKVVPNSKGFSSANFLYSFIPSIIGMLLYIFFLPLDMAIRKLQPWAELATPGGAPASKSLLLDYPSRLPFSCTFAALKNGHYRVATLSLLSTLFIVLPICAGGLFFPLTTPSKQVRMIPNMPCYYIILALLALYFIGLVLLIPGRKKMSMPHGVDCLAEIISFVYASSVLDDAPFRAPKTKLDLVMRLNAVGARGEGKTFGFGISKDKENNDVLNVDRLGRPKNELIILDTKKR